MRNNILCLYVIMIRIDIIDIFIYIHTHKFAIKHIRTKKETHINIFAITDCIQIVTEYP